MFLIRKPDSKRVFLALKEWCNQLDRGEMHVLSRMIQSLPKTRKQINPNIMHKLIATQLSGQAVAREKLCSWLPPSTSSAAVTPVSLLVEHVGTFSILSLNILLKP